MGVTVCNECCKSSTESTCCAWYICSIDISGVADPLASLVLPPLCIEEEGSRDIFQSNNFTIIQKNRLEG